MNKLVEEKGESKKDVIFDLDNTNVADFSDFTDSFFPNEEELQPVGEKFIVFFLNDTQYAVSSSSVSEVVRQLSLTTLPNIPSWVLGIANLRGDIVTVVDLQKLWKKESNDYNSKTKLIVLRHEDSDSLIAFKVDRLREIITLSSEAIEPVKKDDSDFLLGQTKYKSSLINLLDTEKLINSLNIN